MRFQSPTWEGNKLRAITLILTTVFLIPIAFSAVEATTLPSREIGAKDNLVKALRELKDAMLMKVKWDVENTAQAFTEVKKYLRARRWADIARPFLRILEDTIIILSKASDLKDLNTEVNSALNAANTAYDVFSIAMIIQDLQEIGETVHCALSGPSYISAIENMLEEADATAEPGLGFDWKYYKWVIENYLYGTQGKTPVPRIPRRSITAKRRITEFVEGAFKVPASIGQDFNILITEIEKNELPEDFPIDRVISELNELKKQIIWSTGYTTNVKYPAYLQGKTTSVETTLGAIGHLYGDVFGEVAEKVAKKTKIETYVELAKLTETVESSVILLTTKYKLSGVQKPVKITQKITSLAGLSIGLHKKLFYADAEKKFYSLPQEMVLQLPTELSNLWQVADDINHYVRHLLAKRIASAPVITEGLNIVEPSPYYVGDTITSQYTIANKERAPITFDVLTVGGRDPDDQVADFTFDRNVTLVPNESYEYKGTLTLAKPGNYPFFCAYKTPDGEWNASIDLGPGLTDKDRVEDITVKAKEKSVENYYPLEEGTTWEYQLFLKEKYRYFGESHISGKMVMTNFPQRKLRGKKVTPQQEEIRIIEGGSYTRFSFVAEDENGIYTFASQEPGEVEPEIKIPPNYLIKYPIRIGASWSMMITSSPEPEIPVPVTSTVESVDEVVTVPAGTFKECLKIKAVGFTEKHLGDNFKVRIDEEAYVWYAPSVGLVKIILKEKKTFSEGLLVTSPESREMTMQLETFKYLSPGPTAEDKIEDITVKTKKETRPTLIIEIPGLASLLPSLKVYEMKEVPVKGGLIFLLRGKEAVSVTGPEISSSPQMELGVGPIFYLANEGISKYEEVEDGYIVKVNPYVTYDIAIDDFEDEIDLARVELSKEANIIESKFIFSASSQATGIATITITAIVEGKAVASSGPIGIEVSSSREPGVLVQKFTPTTETLSLGIPSKVVMDFYNLWLRERNYNEAEKFLTPEMLKRIEAEGGLKRGAELYYQQYQEFKKIEIVNEEIKDAWASVTVIYYFNGEVNKGSVVLRKINNEWKVTQ